MRGEHEVGDFAEREGLEETARKAEQAYLDLFELANDAILVYDPESRLILDVNGRACEMYGMSREVFVGTSIRDLSLDVPRGRRYLRTLLSRGSYEGFETVHRRADGGPIDVSINAAVVELGGRRVVLSINRDVTENNRRERRLRMQYAATRILAESTELADAARGILRTVCEASGWEFGGLWVVDRRTGVLRCAETWHASSSANVAEFAEISHQSTFPRGVGLPGRVWAGGEACWIPDVTRHASFTRTAAAARAELRGAFASPVPLDGEVVGVAEFFGREARRPEEDHLEAVSSICRQIGQFVERKGAEEALRESERRFRSLVQNASDVITVLGADGKILYESPSIRSVLGYEPDELVGENAFDYVHPEDAERVSAEFASVVNDPGTVPSLGFRFRHKDGSWRHLETTGSNLLDDPGVRGIVANSRDVTERKEAERRLREAEFRYRALVENIPAVTYTQPVGNTAAVGYVSPQFEELFGYSPEHGAPDRDHWSSVIHPDDRERVLAEDERTEEAGGPFRAEYRQLAGDGRFVWVRDEAVLVHDEDGNPLFWQGVIFDITEQKRAEEELRRSEERFRALVRYTSDTITILEADGTVRYTSPAAERILGYRPEEQIGTNGFASIHPDDLERASGLLAEVLSTKGVQPPIEFRVPHRDGSWRHLEIIANNLLDDPSVRGIVINSRDVTGRKRTEEVRLRQTRHASLRAEVGEALASGEDLAGILQRCAEATVRHLGAAFARVWTLDEGEGVLKLRASAGIYTHLDGPHARVPVGEFKIGLIAQERRPHLTNDVLGDPRIADKGWVRREGMAAFAGYPLVVGDRLVGVMGMFAREPLAGDTLEALDSVASAIAQGIERKRIEETLRRSEGSLAEAQRISHLGNFEYDVRKDEAYWSDELYRVFGFAPKRFVPTVKKFLSLVHPGDRRLVRKKIREVARGVKGRRSAEFRIVRPDGEVRVVQAQYEATRGGDGRKGIVGTVQDVTERKALEERLAYQAFHDPLTGLPNRALFTNRLKSALTRSDRRKGSVALLFLDLDNFKVVNDSLGHELGDRLLTSVAERLRRCLRAEDTAARFGGDEFVVLLGNRTDAVEAARVAERVLEALREPFVLDGHELTASASIGIACSGPGRGRPVDLLRDADVAMYRAKERGKAYYAVFEEAMNARSRERLKLESELRRAVERDELKVCYQPKVKLETGEVTGAEALVRWEHPERGLLLPLEFIPVAEETDLILSIGRKVLAEGCRQAREWQERHPGPPAPMLCVNLSARQFQHPGLVEEIERSLRESGIAPGSLELEITESVAMTDVEFVIATLRRLKDLGVRIAIDDFGTGYSSLNVLRRFPADNLKIDKSFVDRLGEDAEDVAIVQMIVALAHTLGMHATAEGIGTAEQLECLRELGCDLGQGNYISEPLPPSDLRSFLAESKAEPPPTG